MTIFTVEDVLHLPVAKMRQIALQHHAKSLIEFWLGRRFNRQNVAQVVWQTNFFDNLSHTPIKRQRLWPRLVATAGCVCS